LVTPGSVTPGAGVIGVVPEVGVGNAESSVPIPELILINCSRLFTPTSCVMYAFGSVGCVGSWFFNSLTSSVRKSLLVIVAPDAALEDELDVVPVVPVALVLNNELVTEGFVVEDAPLVIAVATACDAASLSDCA
jgi:hypothetical protein